MPKQELLPNTKRYFHDIFGVELSINPCPDEGRVPLFLREPEVANRGRAKIKG